MNVSNLFPSITEFSNTIYSDLNSGKLVIVQFPVLHKRVEWENLLSESVVRGFYNSDDFLPENLEPSESNPMSILKVLLGCYDEELFDCLIDESNEQEPLVLSVLSNGESELWSDAFLKLSRALQKVSKKFITRPILLFLTGDLNLENLTSQSSVSLYRFWNMLTWEELRIYSMKLLENADSNLLYQSWQVATYSGASNSDPFLLKNICNTSPSKIEDIINLINCYVDPKIKSPGGIKNLKFTRSDEYWNVPTSLLDDWKDGKILGISIDRGGLFPWVVINEGARDVYARKLIWKEQMSGLFPILMEMSNHSIKWVSAIHGEDWKKHSDSKEHEIDMNVIEPSQLLDIYHYNKQSLKKIPKILLDLLHKLRIVRNKLAHLEAIDARDINELWDKYLLASNAFGNEQTSLYI